MNIEKLEGNANWLTWKFQIRQVLEACDLFDVVDGTVVAPAVGSENYAATLLAWRKRDAKARRTISTTCQKQPLLQIMNCETANAMWVTLKSTYEQASKSNILFLQQKYYGFTKDPGDDIATCLSKLMEIVQQLKDQKESISDSMVMTKILMSLPAEYNHFHSAWESTSAEDQTMVNLRARLMAEELRLKTQGQSENAEALMAKRNFSKKNFNAKKKGKSSEQSNKEKNKGNNIKQKGNCFLCGESTHWKRDCPQNKKNNSNKNNKQENTSSDAFVCHGSTSGGDKNTWVLDSGASDHMCHRREWFTSFVEMTSYVTIGDGKRITAFGRGEIALMAFDENKWVRRRMVNVLYVPEIHLNLFSSGAAMDRGYELQSDNKRCKLLKDGNVFAVGVRREKLFQMLFKIEEPLEIDGAIANVAIKKTSIRAWHERLGHQNVAHVKKFLRNNNVDFVDEDFACEACVYGKHHRGSYKLREEKSKKCGEIIHADVCGPMQNLSIGGSKYFLLLKDDFSHYRFVYFLKHKSEVAAKVKIAITRMEIEIGNKIRSLRSDNGTEFNNMELKNFFDEMGIEYQRTVPYTPEQNGCLERENRTVVESARTMLHSKKMDYKFWAEAVNLAVHVLNRTGTSTVPEKSPYELWHNKEVKFDHLRIFGAEVFVHVPKEKRQKLDPKAVKCIFVGYSTHSKSYRVWNPVANRIEIARDVIFLLEESMATLEIGDADKNTGVDETIEMDTDDVEVTPEQPIVQGAICNLDRRNIIERRLRDRNNITAPRRLSYLASADHIALWAVSEEPKTYEQAIESKDHKQWEQAMNEEYESLVKNRTWILVDPPGDQKVIDNRWVFKLKRNPDESIDRYKARLVVRGFTQEYGVDYHETFSPVVKFTSIRAILALAASKQMKLQQFDVKTAFLNGELEENVYMRQPVGYDDGSERVCKLSKSLYGLKQASRCWNKKFGSFISKFNFVASESDPCVFVCNEKNGLMLLAIYVDDGLIAAENEKAISPVIELLRREFEVKVFELKCFLGLEIEQRSDGSIHVNQQAYARRVINRFGMAECNAVSTPSDNTQNLGDFKADEEISYPYREAVGSLMFLAIATRPDISFAVGNASRHMEKPAMAHVNAIKRILKYIKGTMDVGIWFENCNNLDLCGYSDADYAGDVETRRSTSGYVFMLGNGIISWGSERQKSVALSTTESEYMAAAHAVKELVWLHRLLSEILLTNLDRPTFFMDNQSAIRLVKNPEFHKRTKHIDIRYHFIREKYADGIFNLQYVATDEQVADVMTKALPKIKHQYFCKLMGLMSGKVLN